MLKRARGFLFYSFFAAQMNSRIRNFAFKDLNDIRYYANWARSQNYLVSAPASAPLFRSFWLKLQTYIATLKNGKFVGSTT